MFMELKRVVVTGRGAVTPLGNNGNFRENAIAGKSGAGLLLSLTHRYSKPVRCEVKNFDQASYSTEKKREIRPLLTISHQSSKRSDGRFGTRSRK
jgi:3-oxoacyl-(acyl-carrier-protein) synthase